MYALVCMYFMCTRICRSFTLHDVPLRHPVPTYVHARICTCMYVHIGMYAHIGMYVQMCTHTHVRALSPRNAPLHHLVRYRARAVSVHPARTRIGLAWATSENAGV